jgi:hypothetical protein
MTSIMLYSEHMNVTINLNIAVQAIIKSIALAISISAFAATELDLASPALLPNEAGTKTVAGRSTTVNP